MVIAVNFSEPFPLAVRGGDGSDADKAIRIIAPDSSAAALIEDYFLALVYGYSPKKRMQRLVRGRAGQMYDVIVVVDRRGADLDFWFDVTDPMQGNRNLGSQNPEQYLKQTALRAQTLRQSLGLYMAVVAAGVLRGGMDSEPGGERDARVVYADYLVGSAINLLLSSLPKKVFEEQLYSLVDSVPVPLVKTWKRVGGKPWERASVR